MIAKALMIVSALLLVGTIGWWVHDSIDYGKPLIVSKTAREVRVVEHDPLFGQPIERLELEPGRWLGLFDIAPPFGAVPLSAVWLALGFVGWRLARRSNAKVYQQSGNVMKLLVRMVLVTFFGTATRAEERTFVLSSAGKYSCHAEFTSTAPLETIVGTADGFSGQFSLDVVAFKRASGTVTVTVRSMKTGSTTRDGHMYGSDWLDADRYPTISYAIKRLDNPVITRESDRIVVNATAIGDFTMHGVTKELPAQVTITYLPRSEKTKSIADGDLALVQANFSVPLAQFGVKGKGTIIGSRVGETITVKATLFGISK